jgi:hypothetical protein
MRLSTLVWRSLVLVAVVLVVAIVTISVYERIQLHRAQMMVNALRNTAVRGVIQDEELSKFVSEESCSGTNCFQIYQVSNWPGSGYGFPQFRSVLRRWWPGWRDWMVRARVESRAGKLGLRSIDIWWEPADKTALNPIVELIQTQTPCWNVQDCDGAEILNHPGYTIRRRIRHMLQICVVPDAAPRFVERAFDIRLSCLASDHDCLYSDEVAPRAAEDLKADSLWRANHATEQQRVCSTSPLPR